MMQKFCKGQIAAVPCLVARPRRSQGNACNFGQVRERAGEGRAIDLHGVSRSRRGRARSKSAKLVDEARAFAYLARTMTRHFFALLALLTGLAAFGSPAQASLAEALACDSSIAAAVGDETSGGESAAVQPAPATLSATRAVAAP